MPSLETIQKQDTSTIIIGASVFSGILFGIWQRKGLGMTVLYGILFGSGGAIINQIFKIK